MLVSGGYQILVHYRWRVKFYGGFFCFPPGASRYILAESQPECPKSTLCARLRGKWSSDGWILKFHYGAGDTDALARDLDGWIFLSKFFFLEGGWVAQIWVFPKIWVPLFLETPIC